MNIKLTRTPEAFYLLTPKDDIKVRIKIIDATLFITQVRIEAPSTLSSSQCFSYEAYGTLSCNTYADQDFYSDFWDSANLY